MKPSLALAAVASVAALLAGCATGPYGPGPVAVGYDGYYDGYYGPIYDGYWRGDHFWWRDGAGHPFRRDNDRHFTHQAAAGFQHIHGEPGGGEKGRRPG